MIIRPAAEADLQLVLAIERSSPTAAHWIPARYEAAISQQERLFLVASEAGSISGFLIAFTGTSEWELENIAVLRSARGRGVGQALMRELLEAAQHSGATEVRQEIRASNQAAQGLGQKVGFVQEGRRRGYYQDPDEDALLFKYLLKDASEPKKPTAGGAEKHVKNR